MAGVAKTVRHEWVRENIGGDPDRVTVFGESPGAILARRSILLRRPTRKQGLS